MRILYIDVDSLRPDHLSCYGYHRQTSPHIDELAAEGGEPRIRSDFAQDALGSALRRAGYHTAMISPFPNRHTSYQVTKSATPGLCPSLISS